MTIQYYLHRSVNLKEAQNLLQDLSLRLLLKSIFCTNFYLPLTLFSFRNYPEIILIEFRYLF